MVTSTVSLVDDAVQDFNLNDGASNLGLDTSTVEVEVTYREFRQKMGDAFEIVRTQVKRNAKLGETVCRSNFNARRCWFGDVAGHSSRRVKMSCRETER